MDLLMKIIRPVQISDTGGSFSRNSPGTYISSTGVMSTAGINGVRTTYEYDISSNAYKCKGVLLEKAATNLVLNSESILVTGTRTITVIPGSSYTLSFYGLGTISISGGHTYVLAGGTHAQVRKVYTFIPSTTTITLTISTNIVTFVQVELGVSATSYIYTTSSTASRAEDICTGTSMIYSNILEDEYPQWVSGDTYTQGQRVVYTPTHSVYECIPPTTNTAIAPSINTAHWLKVSATNKYAAFDESPSVVSSNNDAITFILKPGRINSIALLELAGSDAIVNLYAGGSEVYFARQDLVSNENIGNWYEYFYEPFYYQTSLAITELVNSSLIDLPQYADTILCVTILRPGSAATVGSLVCGIEYTLGTTQNGVSLGIIDYSIKESDTFGNTVLTRRKYRKRVRAQVFLYSTKVDSVSNLLTQYRATPLVWIGASAQYNSLVLYGFYKDWDITIANSIGSSLSIEIEGLA
jgi:hypothetical protein